jgi:hypothetical protein
MTGLENILFDPETLRITALLDYDFTHIASPCDEFFYSFIDFHGIVPGPFEDAEMQQLRAAQLSGFQDASYLLQADAGEVDWATAKSWQAALEKQCVQSPADLGAIEEISAVYWFLLDVCPPYFLLPRWLARRTVEQRMASKRETAGNLDKYLSRWGF